MIVQGVFMVEVLVVLVFPLETVGSLLLVDAVEIDEA
jgi:hypothetical protein